MQTDRRTLLAGSAAAVGAALLSVVPARRSEAKPRFAYRLSEAEWRRRLSPAAFAVLRQEDTERAGSSALDHEKRLGTFVCAGCANPLFSSKDKYDSGTGWPSFVRPLARGVATRADRGLFGNRTEVHCRHCGGHLGHVFDDGPRPTGKRYCINGVALRFVPLRG